MSKNQITVGIVVPVEIVGRNFVYVGDVNERRLVVARDEWEKKRPTKSRM